MSGTKWDELFQRFFSDDLTPPKDPVEPLASYEASPLFGRHDVKLASNRRITMPIQFCKDTTSYAVFPHPDGCLWCVPTQLIPSVMKQLESSSDITKQSAFSSLRSESLCTLTLDKRRQITLPTDLVNYIGVTPGQTKVTLLGYLDALEIWDPVKFDKMITKLELELNSESSKD